ncbi:unnamed protein product [Cyprideis torosa]|uniref:Uncharacterized protein n=1 Tax=Cyprideis torosa TaxID=163714 RepID=A0A7R8ZSD7_9CRUS|nr:unnamed protein product [Cyprideis torosa]CAG0906508.1 unnamed protein product [Cyprideis torosa]
MDRAVSELLNLPGNSLCAECRSPNVEWMSFSFGLFLCTECASYHRNLGHGNLGRRSFGRVAPIKGTRLDEVQLDGLASRGNINVAKEYEVCVPIAYRRPEPNSPRVIKEQWIRAKYLLKEFIDDSRQDYCKSGFYEGYLYKKERQEGKYHARIFRLSEVDGTLQYTKGLKKEPSGVIRLADLNACFVPEKMGEECGLQLTYLNSEGTTRHLFVYHDDAQEVGGQVDMYGNYPANAFVWGNGLDTSHSEEGKSIDIFLTMTAVEQSTRLKQEESWRRSQGAWANNTHVKLCEDLMNEIIGTEYPSDLIKSQHMEEQGIRIIKKNATQDVTGMAGILAFTDGSRTEEKTGLGLGYTIRVPNQDDRDRSIALGKLATVHQAEIKNCAEDLQE